MFCVKCGAQIENGEKFCGSCGAVANEQSINPVSPAPINGVVPAQPTKQRSFKLVGIIACAVIAVVVIVSIIAIFSSGGGSYNSILNKYYKAVETTNPDLYLSILAPGYVEDMVGPGNWYSTIDDFKEQLKDKLEDELDDFERDYGTGIKIKILTVAEEPLSQYQKERYTENIYDYFNFKPKSIQDFARLKLSISVTGSRGTGTYTVTEVNMVKTNGKWHRMLGSIE